MVKSLRLPCVSRLPSLHSFAFPLLLLLEFYHFSLVWAPLTYCSTRLTNPLPPTSGSFRQILNNSGLYELPYNVRFACECTAYLVAHSIFPPQTGSPSEHPQQPMQPGRLNRIYLMTIVLWIMRADYPLDAKTRTSGENLKLRISIGSCTVTLCQIFCSHILLIATYFLFSGFHPLFLHSVE
jgi:hypothetical protein